MSCFIRLIDCFSTRNHKKLAENSIKGSNLVLLNAEPKANQDHKPRVEVTKEERTKLESKTKDEHCFKKSVYSLVESFFNQLLSLWR